MRQHFVDDLYPIQINQLQNVYTPRRPRRRTSNTSLIDQQYVLKAYEGCCETKSQVKKQQELIETN